MAMNSVDEPSKWVCRLMSYFERGDPGAGSGFLVNIPGSNKICIMTAGHNIVDAQYGRAKSIEVFFPGGLTFKASSNECFVSKPYAENPTTQSSAENARYDYGLLAIDREKHLVDSKLDPGGCAFSILLTDYELLHMEVSVHGYRRGEAQQTQNTSPLSRVDRDALYYAKETVGGVSGGPVFVSMNGTYTAVAIHNYNSQASRLTLQVMLELLGWIGDYQLRRTLEVTGKTESGQPKPSVYVRATGGSSPTLTARPGNDALNYLRFILTNAPPSQKPGKHQFIVLPPQNSADGSGLFHVLTLVESEKSPQLAFVETEGVRKVNIIGIERRGKGVILWFPSWKHMLHVTPLDRVKRCDYGCITQDQLVKVGKEFSIFNICDPTQRVESTDRAYHSYPSMEKMTSLYRAVCQRDLDLVKASTQTNFNPDESCTCGTSVLSKAAENGDLEIVDLLLQKGARFETRNKDMESPEDLAKRNGHYEVVSKLKHYQDRRVNDYMTAVMTGSVVEMEKLVKSGTPPHARDALGHSALEIAARNGQNGVVTLLLQDKSINVDEQNKRGVTALHLAAQHGHHDVVTLLVQKNAKANIRDNTKISPLHRAAEKGHERVVEALRSAKDLDLNVTGPNNVTPLMLAAQNGHSSMVKILIRLGADPTLEDTKGDTAKDRAERRGHDEIARDLP